MSQSYPSPRKVPAVTWFPLFVLAVYVDHFLAFVFQISEEQLDLRQQASEPPRAFGWKSVGGNLLLHLGQKFAN